MHIEIVQFAHPSLVGSLLAELLQLWSTAFQQLRQEWRHTVTCLQSLHCRGNKLVLCRQKCEANREAAFEHAWKRASRQPSELTDSMSCAVGLSATFLTKHCLTKSWQSAENLEGSSKVGGGLPGIMKMAWDRYRDTTHVVSR